MSGIKEYDSLYSSKEYKKTRLKYFSSEQEAWENALFFSLATNQREPVSRISQVILAGTPEFGERWKKLMLLSSSNP